ncbi:DUF3027 domain-containing protein [Kocuria tytonis]|uniref:DUF3027 domain-containing protein n=1 Tax=Kocuria tytonis TaxID=2054280 RepID=A0A495A6Y5_9MICC|nr:DUF3027 domain-containing protein [Kocuria tytonis]RKQ34064.1 DUF3027 domain-containing protein [Kocuria tytonis]
MSETTSRNELPGTTGPAVSPETAPDAVAPGAAADAASPGSAPDAAAPGAETAVPARAATRARSRTRAPKQDPVLAAAVDLAREAVGTGEQAASGIGEHVGIRVHEDRLLTHLFDCTLPGYPGWTWYATVARAPRTKHVTVCESGILAGPHSLLAPDWVPWEERMQALHEQEAQENADENTADAGAEDAEQPTGTEHEHDPASAADTAAPTVQVHAPAAEETPEDEVCSPRGKRTGGKRTGRRRTGGKRSEQDGTPSEGGPSS